MEVSCLKSHYNEKLGMYALGVFEYITLRLLWPYSKFIIMPCAPRLDAPGVLHHVMARGIMRQTNFRDDSDRDDIVVRFVALANAGAFHVYSWTL